MQNQEFDFRTLLGTIRRQASIIILTFVVLVSIAAVGIFSLKPSYQASTLVLVDPSDRNLLDPSITQSSSSSDNARVESEVSIAKAESTLEQVLADTDLLNDPDFKPSERFLTQIAIMLRMAPPVEYTPAEVSKAAIDKLRNSIFIERQGVTYLISISANASTPEKAALIANKTAAAYIKAQLRSKIDSVLASRDIMNDRVAATRESLVASEQAFSDFIINSAQQIAEATGRTDLETLRLQLQDAGTSANQLSDRLDLAEAALAQGNMQQLSEVLSVPSLQEITNRQNQINAELAAATAGSEQADSLRNELLALVDTFQSSASAELEKLRQQVADERARQSDLQLQLRSNILSSDLPATVLASMYELQQNSEIAKTQYQQLLSRLRDIESQAYLQQANSRIVSPASVPNNPSFPNTRFLLVAAILGSLIVGAALALLRENFIDGVVGVDQMENLTKGQVIAVPHQKASSAPGEGLPNYIIDQPYGSFAEAIRRIMVVIDQSLRRVITSDTDANAPAVIVVTSSNANEGKTTLAISLARAYAQAGKRTILIDADLRRPNVHNLLGLKPSDALITYLSSDQNNNSIASITTRDDTTSASFVLGGSIANAKIGAVVSGARFSRLLAIAISNHDIVILDTPPVGAIVDALHLVPHADVIVEVTKYAQTTQRELKATMRELSYAKQSHADIVCVLNAQKQSRSANKRRFGGYYTD